MVTNLAYTNKNKHGVFSWKIATYVRTLYVYNIHFIYM
jgi:hypothetical protein